MKKALWIIALATPIVLLTGSAFAKEKPDVFGVAPLTKRLEDVGCSFVARGKGWESPAWFVADTEGNWMNFDGQDVKIDDDDLDREHHNYKDIDITLRFGHGIENEGGSTYKRARLILKRADQTRVIKLTGGCGC